MVSKPSVAGIDGAAQLVDGERSGRGPRGTSDSGRGALLAALEEHRSPLFLARWALDRIGKLHLTGLRGTSILSWGAHSRQAGDWDVPGSMWQHSCGCRQGDL